MRYPCLTHGVHIDIHFTFPTKDVLWDCGGKRLYSYFTVFVEMKITTFHTNYNVFIKA